MKWNHLGAAALLLPLALSAQEPDRPKTSGDYASASAAYEELSSRLRKENQAYRDARKQVEASEAILFALERVLGKATGA